MTELASAGGSLEQEIASIERELEQKREALRERGHEVSRDQERETLHEVVRQRIAATPTPSTPQPQALNDVGQAIPPGLEQKVQALVNLAFRQSIDTAIKEVKATKNAALIDAFHDLLVDELFGHLVKRGKIKEM